MDEKEYQQTDLHVHIPVIKLARKPPLPWKWARLTMLVVSRRGIGTRALTLSPRTSLTVDCFDVHSSGCVQYWVLSTPRAQLDRTDLDCAWLMMCCVW